MSVMPASRPAWTASIDVWSSLPPQRQPPRAHAPNATADAEIPLLPRGLIFMVADDTNLPLNTQRTAASVEQGVPHDAVAGLPAALPGSRESRYGPGLRAGAARLGRSRRRSLREIREAAGSAGRAGRGVVGPGAPGAGSRPRGAGAGR